MNVRVLEHEVSSRPSFYIYAILFLKISGTPYNGTNYSCLTVSQVVASLIKRHQNEIDFLENGEKILQQLNNQSHCAKNSQSRTRTSIM